MYDHLSDNRFTGNGKIQIMNDNKNIIKIFGKGKWKDKFKNASVFTFSYKFIFDDNLNEFSIEHMRYGEDNPIYLCRLIKIKENIFKSEEPHKCGEDLYSAGLIFNGDSIKLNWNIKGPQKNIHLEYDLG